MTRLRWQLLTLSGAVIFAVTGRLSTSSLGAIETPQVGDRVVISAPVQLLLYGGDRFLAANLETMRLSAVPPTGNDNAAALYFSRAHRLVAQLNPCHEDNYYIGNALLTWGGADNEGSNLLRLATECRFWDWQPPYFQGINQYFFLHNSDEAQSALNIAAERSPENAAALRKAAIMIATAQIADDHMALNYLEQQLAQTNDPKLRLLLEKRVRRLQGLIILREAQKRFEQQSGRRLANPQELLTSGQLQQFPVDPLGIGYTYEDGKFVLRKLHLNGMEDS